MTHLFLISSCGVEETRRIGQIIGEMAEAGAIMALEGDLGSGKTALVQGIARGLKVPETVYVTSPSYTLVNEYPGKLPLFHLDLYRLSDLDFEDIGLYDILDSRTAVVAVEWAERLNLDSLFEYLTLQMEITGENTRNIIFIAVGDRHIQLLTRIESRIKENPWH
jgi:tRNA threonylcarbamoyladenosine biosynthesis protein TsaE